jgi:GH15 family glucan-1,4-alpha-glucosidase
MRSLLTLKALTYEPSGGIVAAVTTSLPEAIGGVRNWDYRFCWLRDATMTLTSLMAAGYEQEAKDWREWLLRAMAGDPPALQIMYGPAGEARLPELELPWLPGYEGSTPVRTGNAAVEQFQLDVYGEVMDALHKARRLRIEPHPSAWALQRALLEFLEDHWRQPDEGIWEVRGPRRHFTHSKVLAWVAMDRAVKGVEQFGMDGPVERWRRLRTEIHQEVCQRAYDPDRGTFTQSYGSRELDASLLLIPLVGFLPPSDPRVRGTVEAIERELCEDGFVLRYPTGEQGEPVDGLPGREGAFLACTFWLADNYALLGRVQDARHLFQRLLDLRNDVGLLAEEYDPAARRQLGNFPQAFSHVPLIDTAMHLAQAGPDPRCLRFEDEVEDAARQ